VVRNGFYYQRGANFRTQTLHDLTSRSPIWNRDRQTAALHVLSRASPSFWADRGTWERRPFRARRMDGWRRVIIENLSERFSSRQALNREIKSVLHENQIYPHRITTLAKRPYKPHGVPVRQCHLRTHLESPLRRSRGRSRMLRPLGVELRGGYFDTRARSATWFRTPDAAAQPSRPWNPRIV